VSGELEEVEGSSSMDGSSTVARTAAAKAARVRVSMVSVFLSEALFVSMCRVGWDRIQMGKILLTFAVLGGG